MEPVDDYAQHSIKLEQLHKRLDAHLLNKEFSEAHEVACDMQEALRKLHNWCERHQ